jgi:hypothetical protein|tara:strand:+ start:294 stop:506 length:213 start_codon:yes stop_codon:yes gene_type:complete
MKEYEWEITASGALEAESEEDARIELEKYAEHYVSDDKKYWVITIDTLIAKKENENEKVFNEPYPKGVKQ